MAEADSTPTSTARPAIDIPDEILSVLPSDPFEQLDVARKITSIALSTRLSKLESECASLQSCLDDKDDLISDLQAQLESLESSLAETSDRLLRADQEKERLLKENNSLSSTVNKLNRDVSKLEVFRKTLMQSLEEDGEDSAGGYKVVATSHESSSSTSPVGGGGARLPPSKYSSIRNQFSEAGNSFNDDTEIDASRPRISQSLLLASQSSTPRLTPPGSPQNLSASTSPTITSKPASPRRHSLSFSTTRGMFDDRTSTFSSLPSSQQSSITSSADIGSQTGRARVDGKEFFRQVRTRLSYEQFAAFLANVKELNSHKQTKEETLRKADEIFGPDNKDLYTIFEGLITRTSH